MLVTTGDTLLGREYEPVEIIHILSAPLPTGEYVRAVIGTAQEVASLFRRLGEVAEREGADGVVGVRLMQMESGAILAYGTMIRFV